MGGRLIFSRRVAAGAGAAGVPFASTALLGLLLLDISVKTDLLGRGFLVLAVSDVAAAVSTATCEWGPARDQAVLPLTVVHHGVLGVRSRSRRHGLHPPNAAICQPDLDAARVVPACQNVGDDALHGAACWLVGLEHDVDACAGNNLPYCGHGRMSPSVHFVRVSVSLCVGDPARNGRRVEGV